jgi:hypothetical protein
MGGAIQAVLDPGAAAVLTTTFDQVMLVNPGLPPIVRTQNPAVAAAVVPGRVAFFQAGVGPVTDLVHAAPGGPPTTVHFA